MKATELRELSEDELQSKEADLKDDKLNKEEILYKYYNSFFRTLKRLSRPVTGIYDERTNRVEILGRAFFIPEFQNEALLDIKSISHESPIEVLLTGLPQLILLCIGLPISIMKVIKMGEEIKIKGEELRIKKLERKIKEEELKQAKTKTRNTQLKLDQKEIDAARKKAEKIVGKFQEESEKLSIKEIVKIPINIINIGLRNVFVKLKEKSSEISKTNKFEIKDIKKEYT